MVNNNDLISRSETIKAIMSEHPDLHYADWYAAIVRNMPSAVPPQKEGDE